MSISDLMRTPVQTVQGSCTIADAARAMVKHSVGALVIADASGRPTGIVTDRDLVTMISEGLDPKQATLGSLVRPPLVTANIDDNLAAITKRMKSAGVRRIPIVDRDGALAGIVSLDDLLIAMAQTFSGIAREVSDVAGALKAEFIHEHAVKTHLAALLQR
jgi:CBS domain-containing protein